MALNKISPATTALLLNDLQVDIISGSPLAPSDPDALARFDDVVQKCALALQASRSAGATVIHVRHVFSPGHPEASPFSPLSQFVRQQGLLVDGDPGAAIDARVAPVAGETVIRKQTISPFCNTGLDTRLREGGIDTVVVGGLVTHFVVDSAVRDASDRGYQVLLLEDGCASATPARHETSLANLSMLAEVITVATFCESLG